MSLLDYENQMFLDAFHEDGLLVTAKGLGIDRILKNFIKVHCDPANLVLVLNVSSTEVDYLTEQLEIEGVKPLPKVITNEYNASDRQSIYLQGGVLFITSRILVVDLLTDRVPIDHVTGILVYKAHKIIDSCQEAFILRLYRQKNNTGFIKAFSDSPESFTSGFCQVERVMKSLFVRKLFLWPRFHANVVSCMEQHQIDVVEVQLHLTPAMMACQSAILDLINACLKELKRCTPAIDSDEVTVENALTRNFDQVLRLQLDPIWHQLGPKTKQLVSDLKTLRLVLRHLTQYDCVTFYSLVKSIRSSEKTFGQNSGWLFLDAADSLFVHAKERIYGPEDTMKKAKVAEETTRQQENRVPILEQCPKWEALSEILAEIEEENVKQGLSSSQGRTLIAAEDDRTCTQIKDYLCEGGSTILARMYNKYVALKLGLQEVSEKKELDKYPNKSKGRGKMTKKPVEKPEQSSCEYTLTQMVGKIDDNTSSRANPEGNEGLQLSSQDAYYGILSSPAVVVHPLHGCSDHQGLMRTLQEVQPRYVILYDADMQFVRQLELFKCTRPGLPLRVYFVMYTGSTEEQRYLTTLRKEKEAFEYLIRTKATMVIPEERDGKAGDAPNLARDSTPASETVSSRKGAVEKPQEQRVIVDMREFRSELPSLIHRRGIEIEPVTLEVGDYIITPEMCIERKSVSDLIGSLNNGRLYNQCVSMCRYYRRPILLIEFDPTKSFSLQGKYDVSREVSIQDVTSRLTLITIHFPKLRILWCPSPYATAELIQELKIGRDQPDGATAMTVTAAEEELEWSDRYNHGPQDMLLKMPGINSRNYRQVMNKVESIAELSSLSQEYLTELLGNSGNAESLWKFLHQQGGVIEESTNQKPSYKKNSKSNFHGKGNKSSR
ncbi:DNA repair endonuclease XPF-like [Liolophura sinensis]|uniref:DNA repair endonuclease XPF-like n=1 Tax=Liolophura sinensis TaxID=3198878 RepID=UPI003158494D